MKRGWIYSVATILVGVLWYVAFLIAPGGWELMTKPYLLGGSAPIVAFLCFPLTSVLLGALSRPIFERASRWHAVLTGLGVSLIGSILYVWLLYWLQSAIDVQRGGNFDDFDLSALIAFTVIGPFMALQYGFVTVPVGIASGLLLHWASRPRIRLSPSPLAR